MYGASGFYESLVAVSLLISWIKRRRKDISASAMKISLRYIDLPDESALRLAYVWRLFAETTKNTPNISRRGASHGMRRSATRCRLSIAAAIAATRTRIPIKRRSVGFIATFTIGILEWRQSELNQVLQFRNSLRGFCC